MKDDRADDSIVATDGLADFPDPMMPVGLKDGPFETKPLEYVREALTPYDISEEGFRPNVPIIPAPMPKGRTGANGLPENVEANYQSYGALAETSIIQTAFLDGNLGAFAVQTLKPYYFHNPTRRKIFQALCQMAEKDGSTGFDPITLRETLRALGFDDLANDAITITQYIDFNAYIKSLNANPNNFIKWCEIVIRAYVRRRIQALAYKAELDAMAADKEIEDIFAQLEDALRELKSLGVRLLSRTAEVVVEERMTRRRNKEAVDVVPTGIRELDALLKDGGLKRDDYTVIAARPYHGKTTLGVEIVSNMCKAGRRGLWVPLEMSDDGVIEKFVQNEARISYEASQGGWLTDDDWRTVSRAEVQVADYDLHITNKGLMTLPMIWAEAAKLHAKKRLDFIVVDQLYLITADRRHSNRVEEIEYHSRQLKLLTQELKIPVIVMHQINREGEKASEVGSQRLSLLHLRGAGGIEQDIDNAILIQPPDDENIYVKQMEITLAKQRKGRAGFYRSRFEVDFGLFAEIPNSRRFGLSEKRNADEATSRGYVREDNFK